VSNERGYPAQDQSQSSPVASPPRLCKGLPKLRQVPRVPRILCGQHSTKGGASISRFHPSESYVDSAPPHLRATAQCAPGPKRLDLAQSSSRIPAFCLPHCASALGRRLLPNPIGTVRHCLVNVIAQSTWQPDRPPGRPNCGRSIQELP
jgi:hypothetical protein